LQDVPGFASAGDISAGDICGGDFRAPGLWTITWHQLSLVVSVEVHDTLEQQSYYIKGEYFKSHVDSHIMLSMTVQWTAMNASWLPPRPSGNKPVSPSASYKQMSCNLLVSQAILKLTVIQEFILFAYVSNHK